MNTNMSMSERWGALPCEGRRQFKLKQATLVALVAAGCPRVSAGAVLGVSQPTLSRYMAVIEQEIPGFGTPEWRAAYHERQLEDARQDIAAQATRRRAS